MNKAWYFTVFITGAGSRIIGFDQHHAANVMIATAITIWLIDSSIILFNKNKNKDNKE